MPRPKLRYSPPHSKWLVECMLFLSARTVHDTHDHFYSSSKRPWSISIFCSGVGTAGYNRGNVFNSEPYVGSRFVVIWHWTVQFWLFCGGWRTTVTIRTEMPDILFGPIAGFYLLLLFLAHPGRHCLYCPRYIKPSVIQLFRCIMNFLSVGLATIQLTCNMNWSWIASCPFNLGWETEWTIQSVTRKWNINLSLTLRSNWVKLRDCSSDW